MTFPTTLLDWASLFAALVTTVTALIGAGYSIYRLGYRSALEGIRQENLVKRYENIYVPMSNLFMTRPVTGSRAILAPYFQQRWVNAKKLLKEGRILRACRALFDKKTTKELVGFELGHDFPLGEIHQILEDNEAYADEKLLQLVQEVDRLGYEIPAAYDYPGEADGLMTDEELTLFNHIAQTHTKLKRTFSPD